MKTFILLLSLVFTSGAEASWREFWVNGSHEFYNKSRPFSARISFTVERLPVRPGDRENKYVTGKLYIEIFTFENPGYCPKVHLSQKLDQGARGELVYPVALSYESSTGKCWGELTEASEGYYPGGRKTTYGISPLTLKNGQVKQANRLYVQSARSYKEFDFSLADTF